MLKLCPCCDISCGNHALQGCRKWSFFDGEWYKVVPQSTVNVTATVIPILPSVDLQRIERLEQRIERLEVEAATNRGLVGRIRRLEAATGYLRGRVT